MQDKREMLITLHHHCQRRQWADEVSPSGLSSPGHKLGAGLTYGTNAHSHLRSIYTCQFRQNICL